jgi:predicted transcriptional regulator
MNIQPVRFEIRLRPNTRRRLDSLAQEVGISATALTRLALEQFLRRPPAMLAYVDEDESQEAA